ncbi:MAG: GNAT family N-acetyltransferase [Thermoplasmata archaeon]|nr:GNAT family N-acetyltransferase [Thermoplasmata archaeon]
MTTLRPIAEDPETARTLTRKAIFARNESEEESGRFLSAIERDVTSGTAMGVLRSRGEEADGIALWSPPSAIGLTVEVLYLVDGRQTADAYREFYSEIASAFGPVALAPGLLVGLAPAEEERVMRELGFARFTRSEMRFPPDTASPAVAPSAGLRTVRGDDEAELVRLHALAYRESLDRYLFLADLDPVRDAELQIRDIVTGRWGEFLPWASFVLETNGRLESATLVVRAPYGALIADVMTDPESQGRGLGRAVLGSTVRALREREETVIALNVTDGNSRAFRLYQRLGFVRSLGPSHGWYSTERIQVPVGRD